MQHIRYPILPFKDYKMLMKDMLRCNERLNVIFFYIQSKDMSGNLCAEDSKELSDLDAESFELRKRIQKINATLKYCCYSDYCDSDNYTISEDSFVKVLIYDKPSEYETFFQICPKSETKKHSCFKHLGSANISLISPNNIISHSIIGKKPGEEFTYEVNSHVVRGHIIFVLNENGLA